MNIHIAEPSEYQIVDQIAHDAGLACEWSSKGALDAGIMFIVGEGGFVIVREQRGGLAEVDVVIAPYWRGRQAMDAARDVITTIFETCDVTALVGRTPVENRAAMAFAMTLGFKRCGENDSQSWTTRLDRKDWPWVQG